MTWEEFVRDKIWTSNMGDLIAQYETLERDGVLGECELRTLAESWGDAHVGTGSVTRVMGNIAMECYKEYAHRYMNSAW